VTPEEQFRDRFCDLATQYYIAARLAAKAQLAPVYGNLFHHAVEMFLKGALVGALTIERLRSKEYGHQLLPLWERFKQKEGDPALDRFDPAVGSLHDFESIRYPDEIVERGMLVLIGWEHDIRPAAGSGPPRYQVLIQQVDRLIIELLHRADRNPKAYSMMRASQPLAREALIYLNPEAASWL
jgi:hypothetical protein